MTVAIGALLIVAGGAALGYALTRKAQGTMSPKASAAMTAAMAEVDAEIGRARSKLRGGAEALSKLVAVQVAVAADQATARDAVEKGELSFSPDPGVVIELGQQIGEDITTLVVQPADATPFVTNDTQLLLAQPSSHARLDKTTLSISEVVPVKPRSDDVRDGKKITGYIAASRTIDMLPIVKKLEDAGITGYLRGANAASVPIGVPKPDAKHAEYQLPSQTGFGITGRGAPFDVVVDLPPMQAAVPKGIVGAGTGAIAFGLVLVVVGMMRRPREAPAQPSLPSAGASMETVPSGPYLPHAATQYSAQHPVASGTPSPVDAASASAINPADLARGAMIGRWEVIRRLGSGGMADVYLAHSKGEAGFEKLVAIKVMHSHLARNQRAVDHFLDEARLAARISHPNVVAIQDLGKIGNDYVIVMDYVEGVDLERLLASARLGGRPVPLDVALGILCRICDGLHAAHRATSPDGTPLGIIHRDVKSANVLVSRQGGVKVVDFGIAKAATQSHNTIAGETKGTPSMMAPEQRVGEQVDVRVDVYSVAAVGFEIVTGHAVNLDLAALAHLGVENWPHLPPPSSLRADLPRELDDILLAAMAFERERRPPDCAQFEAMFERVMKTYGLSCTDKDIARWVQAEIGLLVPAFEGASSVISKPAGAS